MEIQATIVRGISWCFNYLIFEFPCGDVYTIWHEQQVTPLSGQFVLACLTHPQVKKIKRWTPFISYDTVWVLQYSWQNWFLARLGCFKWHLFFWFSPRNLREIPQLTKTFYFQMGWDRHPVVQFSCISLGELHPFCRTWTSTSSKVEA